MNYRHDQIKMNQVWFTKVHQSCLLLMSVQKRVREQNIPVEGEFNLQEQWFTVELVFIWLVLYKELLFFQKYVLGIKLGNDLTSIKVWTTELQWHLYAASQLITKRLLGVYGKVSSEINITFTMQLRNFVSFLLCFSLRSFQPKCCLPFELFLSPSYWVI